MSTKQVKPAVKAPGRKAAPEAAAPKAPMTATAAIAAATVEPVAEPVAAEPETVTPAVVETATIEPKPAVQPAATEPKGPTMTDTVNTAAEQTKNFAQDAQAKATAMFADVNTRAKAAMERSTKLFEELNEFSKGNVEALVESSKVAAKVAEQLGQNAAETARKNFEQATAALKSFASAKTPTEFFQLQSDYARSAFDQLIAETSKNSETALKLAGDIFQPISNRFAVAAEKIKLAA
jgi:phasin family protein